MHQHEHMESLKYSYLVAMRNLLLSSMAKSEMKSTLSENSITAVGARVSQIYTTVNFIVGIFMLAYLDSASYVACREHIVMVRKHGVDAFTAGAQHKLRQAWHPLTHEHQVRAKFLSRSNHVGQWLCLRTP